MVSVKQAPKYYFVEFTAGILLYMGSMYLRHGYARSHPDASLLKSLVLLSPIAPCLLIIAAIIRFYRHMDEMQQRLMLEQIGIGALVCALGSITLALSHDAGLPAIGIGWAWPLMGSGWLLVTAWRGWRGTVTELGLATTLRKTFGMMAFVALPTLAYRFAAPVLGWPSQPFWTVMMATAMIIILAGLAIFRREPR